MGPFCRPLAPRANPARAGHAAYSQGREYVAVRGDHGLPLVRSSARATIGVEKRRAPVLQRWQVVAIHVPDAEQIRVVLDNLISHTAAALYEVFPSAKARQMLRILELHLTSVHGSCLHMAELELAVLTRQCLKRRIPDAPTLAYEAAAWEARRNRHQATIDWRFTTRDARIKLKRLYPKYSTYRPRVISFAPYAAEGRTWSCSS
jgi:hypothetical protein